MRIHEAFPSPYLKKEDVTGELAVTIAHVAMEDIGQGDDQERKPVVYFEGKDRGMVLNKGNAQAIAEIAGNDEMNAWPGVQIVLYVDKNIAFQGKRVGGIRVKSSLPF